MNSEIFTQSYWHNEQVIVSTAFIYGFVDALLPQGVLDAPLSALFSAGVEGAICSWGSTWVIGRIPEYLRFVIPCLLFASIIYRINRRNLRNPCSSVLNITVNDNKCKHHQCPSNIQNNQNYAIVAQNDAIVAQNDANNHSDTWFHPDIHNDGIFVHNDAIVAQNDAIVDQNDQSSEDETESAEDEDAEILTGNQIPTLINLDDSNSDE